MADATPTTIFAPIGMPTTPTTAVNGWNSWYCTLCGVRKPDPVIHTQWHSDLAAYMKSSNPTYTTTQPTLAARLGLTLDFTSLITGVVSLLRF